MHGVSRCMKNAMQLAVVGWSGSCGAALWMGDTNVFWGSFGMLVLSGWFLIMAEEDEQ